MARKTNNSFGAACHTLACRHQAAPKSAEYSGEDAVYKLA
nr:MAG TPA: hypothetical protein [Caudoviricetes sp.]